MHYPTTTTDRATAFDHQLIVAATLVASDAVEQTHPEYLRALSEQACMASGINTEHKEDVESIIAGFARNGPIEADINAFTHAIVSHGDEIETAFRESGQYSSDVATAANRARTAGGLPETLSRPVKDFLFGVVAGR